MRRRRATSNITDRRHTENIIRVRTIRDRITDDKILTVQERFGKDTESL